MFSKCNYLIFPPPDYKNDILSFDCRRELHFNHFGNPYFQFFFEITMKARNVAEGNFISNFLIIRSRDVHQNPDIGQYPSSAENLTFNFHVSLKY